MNDSVLPYGTIEKISFTRRPVSLPADIRPFRRIGQLLLVLHLACSKGKAPILKIQFFNTLFSSSDKVDEFLENYELEKAIKNIHIRIDPFINRAISLAIGRKYIKVSGKDGHLQLLDKGEKLAIKITEDSEIFDSEKVILNFVRKSVSSAKLNRIFRNS